MILVSGCSFTQGYNLPSTELSWPSLVAKQLGLPLVNSALGGASNRRIVRTLHESLVASPDVKIVVAGWTVHVRNEIHARDGDYVRVSPKISLGEMTMNQDNRPLLDAIQRQWLSTNFNIWLNYREWVHDVLLLQDYLRLRRIKFKFFIAFGNNHLNDFLQGNDAALQLSNHAWAPRGKHAVAPNPETHLSFLEMKNLVNKIDLSHWVLENKETMKSYLESKGDVPAPDGHPGVTGHRLWADVVAQELQ